MKKLYPFLAILLFACWATPAFAQSGHLSGSLQDEKGEPVSYANIALMQAADSSLVSGAVSDDAGNFSLKTPEAGTYLLRLSAIGFAQQYTAPFKVSGKDFSKDFGKMTIREDVQLLQEVTVQSMRPTIVNHADKMVVSIEGTALAAGSTALDVLSKSPGVWVDQDGNIQLNGQAGARVMIDGRLTYLSAKELQNLLQAMPAENIKDIEIITNPTAKYDAEGSSGIININLKKNTLSGFNGSVYGGFQYNGLEGYSAGTNLNHKQGKWNTFASFDMARRARSRDAEFTREFNTASSRTNFDQVALEDVIRKAPSMRLGTDYDLSDRHSVGAMLNLAYQDATYDFRTDTYIRNGNEQQDLLIDADNYTNSHYMNGTLNLHYLGKLDTLGSTLSADLDFVRISDRSSASFTNRYDSLATGTTDYLNLLTSENPTHYDIFAAKIDWSKVLPNKRKLEVGAKASRVVSDNELNFYTHEGEQPLLDTRRSNHFIYEENIYAAYVTFSTPIGSKLNLQAGLRAEQTVAEGRSLTEEQVTPREYLDFFPSVFVQQSVSDNYQINYKYSRRINRPHYEQLNPFIFYLDPYTWARGNPYLRPQYTHSIGITQTFMQTYNLILDYSRTTDFIAEVPQLNDETMETVFNNANVDDAENISATLVAPIKIMKNWDMNNNATFAYQSFSTVLDNELQRNNRFFYMAQSTHNIMLPKSIRMEVNAGYQGPLAWGLYQIKGNWWVDLGLKKSFMDDKLDLSVNITDIFKSRWVIGETNIGDDINSFNQYFSARSLGINLRYRFSKGEKFESRQRNSNLEELNRAGGN